MSRAPARSRNGPERVGCSSPAEDEVGVAHPPHRVRASPDLSQAEPKPGLAAFPLSARPTAAETSGASSLSACTGSLIAPQHIVKPGEAKSNVSPGQSRPALCVQVAKAQGIVPTELAERPRLRGLTRGLTTNQVLTNAGGHVEDRDVQGCGIAAR